MLTWPVPYALLWLASFFDGSAALAIVSWDSKYKLSNERASKILKVKFRPVKPSILEMADSLIESGYVVKKEKSSFNMTSLSILVTMATMTYIAY